MAGFTNKGKFRVTEKFFRDAVTMYAVLCTDAVAPGPDINTISQLTEIPAGNGYTAGGMLLTRNATDFPTLTEDDSGDVGEITVKDLVWTASGGPLPSSGAGARYLVFTDNNATPSAREVLFYHDLQMNRIVSAGQPLTVNAAKITLAEA